MHHHLEKVDPASNCFRFYVIAIEKDLLSDFSLMIHWGRIGTRGQYRIKAGGSRADVMRRAGALMKSKLKKGYLPS